MNYPHYSLPFVIAAIFLFLFPTVCFAQITQNTGKTGNRIGVAAPKQQEYRPSEYRQPENRPPNLPLDKLPPEVRRYVKSFRQHYTLYREMPRLGFNCDKEMFCFLKQHPDLVVGFWEVFGTTEISLKEVKENRYRMTETSGTTADVSVLYQTPEISIVYAKGEFRSPMLVREIEGETLLILYSQFTEDKNGNPFIICRLETFIRIENGGADFLARLFSSMLGKIADGNYEQTLTFVSKLSAAAGISPHNVKKIANLVKNVRSEVIADFDNTADNVFERTEVRRERFLTEHTEFAFQANEELPLSEPFFYEKQLSEKQRLPEKQNYVVPSPPFGKNYSVPEQPPEVIAEEITEVIESAEQKKINTATDSDTDKEEASKSKGGAVFGKPKVSQ